MRDCPKPFGISFDCAAHLAPVVSMFDAALGREDGFRSQPFCFGVIVHAVSPLRFAPEGVEIMQQAIRARMPLQICTATQAGATSPVRLAGALAQRLARCRSERPAACVCWAARSDGAAQPACLRSGEPADESLIRAKCRSLVGVLLTKPRFRVGVSASQRNQDNPNSNGMRRHAKSRDQNMNTGCTRLPTTIGNDG